MESSVGTIRMPDGLRASDDEISAARPFAPWRAGGGATTRDLSPIPHRPPPPMSPDARDHQAQVQRKLAAREADLWGLMVGEAVQARGELDDGPPAIHARAAEGVAGAAAELPHRERIQESFGHHDVGGIRAHVGGAAAVAATAIGAEAYATGTSVAFRQAPDLHTAAHEAAHVVQQRAGVHLKGGVGQQGDAYEEHADRVADRVVSGQSAVDLLDAYAGTGGGSGAIQRKGASADELDGVPARLTQASPATARLNPAHSAIERTKASVALLVSQVHARAIQLGPARARLAALSRALYEPIAAFAEAERQPQNADMTATLTRWKPDVLDTLNEIARANLLIDRAMAGTVVSMSSAAITSAAGQDEMRSVMATLSTVGAGVGWLAPSDLEAAEGARNAHEPCREGAQLARPDVCQYSDTKRVDLRAEARTAASQIVVEFGRVCHNEAAALEPLLKARKEARKAAVDIFAELITIGVSMAAPEVAPIVAAATRDIGKDGKPSAVAEGLADALKKALDPGIDAVKDEFSNVSDADMPESGTINMINTLVALLAKEMRAIGPALNRATDDELTQLLGSLQSVDASLIKSRVSGFVAKYRAQIEPIGNTAARENSFGVNTAWGTHKAVRVKLGAVARPALVKQLRPQGAGPLANGAAAGEFYEFVRWIDDDMTAMAGPMTDLAADKIRGLALGDLMQVQAPR